MNSEWQSLPPQVRQGLMNQAASTEPPRSVAEVKSMLESTEKGGVRNSIKNCLTVFQLDPLLSGAVAYNLLTDRTDLLKPIDSQKRPGSSMTDTDMKYIRLYLEETYGLTSEKKIADAADLAAHQNSYHPVRDYLNSLTWDGTERSGFVSACATFWEPQRTGTPLKPCACFCWEPSTGHSVRAVNLKSCSVWWADRGRGNPSFLGSLP